MTRKEKEYRRLPGRGMRRQGMVSAVRVISTVWLGKDHLLCIDSTGGYAEDYKRFYFRDIEAIIVRKTDRWHFSSLILGTLFLVPALIGLGVSGIGWRIFWFVFAGTFFLLFAPNWLRGPTCVCHLRTAVQTEELPSLRRLRTARKVIGIVKPLIEQAQGTVTPEEVRAKLQETLTRSLDRSPSPAAGPSTAAGAVAGLRQASPVSTYNGRMHAVLFTLLMVDALRVGVDFFVNNLLIAAVEVLLWSGIGVSVIMGLIKQQHSAITAGLRRLTWGVFAYVVAGFVIGYVNYIAIAIEHSGSRKALDQGDVIRIYSQKSPFDSAWLMGTMVFQLLCSVVLGLCGWMMLRRFRKISRAPPPLAPVARQTPAGKMPTS